MSGTSSSSPTASTQSGDVSTGVELGVLDELVGVARVVRSPPRRPGSSCHLVDVEARGESDLGVGLARVDHAVLRDRHSPRVRDADVEPATLELVLTRPYPCEPNHSASLHVTT
jgi:hypothetical protein